MGCAKGDSSSTIVDMSDDDLRILREGPISEKKILKVLHKKK